MANTNKITIILPTLNEEKNILKICKKLNDLITIKDCQIMFVDDGSTDSTRDIIIQASNTFNNVTYLFRENDKDISRSFIDGVKLSNSEYVLLMDSDLQHDASYVMKFIKYAEKYDYDFINGSRFLQESLIFKSAYYKIFRIMLSKIFIYFMRILIKIDLTDPLSGFFIVKREKLIRNIPKMYKSGWKIMLDFYLSCDNDLSFLELPIKINKRVEGESKINFKVALGVIKMIIFHRNK